jgi:hypothetical protein
VRKHGRVPSFFVFDFVERCNEKEAKFERNEFCKVGGEDCEAESGEVGKEVSASA